MFSVTSLWAGVITEKSRPGNVCDENCETCSNDCSDASCHPYEEHSSSKISALLFEMKVKFSISFLKYLTCTECCTLNIESRTYNLYTYVQSQHNVTVIKQFKRINGVSTLCVSIITSLNVFLIA